MRISERIEAATDVFMALDFAAATPKHLRDIADRFGLTDAQFQKAAMAAVSKRMKVTELQQIELDKRTAVLVLKCAAIGTKQAEIDILRAPLPWSHDLFVEMTDLMVDHFLSQMTADEDNEGSELICTITAAARQAFIKRVVELSTTSFPEVRA